MTDHTEAVIDRHLRYRRENDLERDLGENYAPDVVLLSYEGVHVGHDGVRTLAGILRRYVAADDYSYDQIVVHGEHALLRWSAAGDTCRVDVGVDSFVVRGGRIVAQTIYFKASSAHSAVHP
jgi:hypothetical protein